LTQVITMPFRCDNPPAVAAPDGHFSQCAVIERGTRLLHISGQVARSASGALIGAGDMTLQAEQVFTNLRDILAHYGADFRSAIKVTIFVVDMARVDEVFAVRRRFYGDAMPASTLVGVTSLGDPDWLLEIELIAEI
jgi:2-iminobutanoate/2-iminopropanoate deaminase